MKHALADYDGQRDHLLEGVAEKMREENLSTRWVPAVSIDSGPKNMCTQIGTLRRSASRKAEIKAIAEMASFERRATEKRRQSRVLQRCA